MQNYIIQQNKKKNKNKKKLSCQCFCQFLPKIILFRFICSDLFVVFHFYIFDPEIKN